VLAPLLATLTAIATLQAPVVGSAGVGDPYFPKDGNGGIDVVHYDIHDHYGLRSGHLSGRTALDLRATEDLSRFDLDFLLPVTSVTVDGAKATWQRAGDHELRITPRHPLAAGSAYRVVVRYAGQPGRYSSQGEANWLADEREVVAMNEPHMATWWFPANDHPTDKATYDITITAPKGRQVIANGQQVATHTRHGQVSTTWREDDPMASYLAFFAVGRFEVRTGSTDGIPWTTAISKQLPAQQRAGLETFLAQSGPITSWLQSVVGPYPFDSTGGLVTALPVTFALENQTRPTYPAVAPGNVPLEVHELAHQWFGDSVSVADWSQIWLNEGFAQFLQHYWVETHGGVSTQSWLEATYDTYAGEPSQWDVRIEDPGAERVFDSQVYDRGAMTLAALRHRVGDTAFFTILRDWAAQHQYATGRITDFEALAAQVSGQDLSAFFTAWLHDRHVPARSAANGF
jgi:aminopeptidase N